MQELLSQERNESFQKANSLNCLFKFQSYTLITRKVTLISEIWDKKKHEIKILKAYKLFYYMI